MSHDRTVIRHAVEEIGFGFFTDDEVRALSVKRITSPVTFDTMNNPLPGGLYDPALGPVDRYVICETCGEDFKNCPGHIGHIELAVSVYHPLLFGTMYKILRAKCFNCHRLRLSRSTVRVLAVKIMLLDAGRGQEALELDDLLLGYLRQEGLEGQAMSNDPDTRELLSANAFKERVLSDLECELLDATKSKWCGGHDRMLRRQLVDGFIKSMGAPKKCENCGAISPVIRKEGSNKLFQEPLSEKSRQINRACNTDVSTALKEIDPGETLAESRPADDSDSMHEDESEGEGDDADGSNPAVNGGDAAVNGPSSGAASQDPRSRKFVPPLEVELQMKHLWREEATILNLVFNAGEKSAGAASPEDGYSLFFVSALAVPPPRFRPPMHLGDIVAEHPQNVSLNKVLSLNEKLQKSEGLEGEALTSMLSTWIELQTTVDCFMDSNKDPRGAYAMDKPPGIRQILEKKEGLFRKHMMGKRVNYACRSVISPDPCLGTSEIGIPMRFAMELTYPVPVATWNVETMRNLVEAGCDAYPGAKYVEAASGRMVFLDKLSQMKRKGLAARLLSLPGQKVWRHLQDGDCMLVNRQPTLHKPGIMAHRVRVLRNPSYQTIRMHYANCNTYNADFDGDEINCHLPQNEVARAEANLLAFTDEQYLVPTSGKPLRGLIQDHVDAGVKMCSKDCFFSKEGYQQLVFQAVAGLPGLEIVSPSEHIETPFPAILKPRQRWTGKQVISSILKHLTYGLPQLNLDSKTKTPAVAFGPSEMEHQVVFRGGELMQGVLDKAAFGHSEFGMVHAVHELYGATAAGKLLTALGRLFTTFLQYSGHTCGIEDLTLNAKAEAARRRLIEESRAVGQRSMRELLDQDGAGGEAAPSPSQDETALTEEEVGAIRRRTATFLLGEGRDGRMAEIDRHMQSALAPVSSSIIKACLPQGQEKPFPSNCFSLMVLTGGKGSMVNHSQVSCALGQQALEGRRVPLMVSGKSLPSFQAYEPSPRANGFITDRFLTGIRPQEYYFHCMAGREGLVDTAVKTSRSGYLQRCLVKHLEELKVSYDHTVRDGEGCVVQFLYGEDGVDTTQTKYLSSKQLDFMARNSEALKHKHGVSSTFVRDQGFDTSKAVSAHSAVSSSAATSTCSGGDVPVDHRVSWKVGQHVMARRRVEGDEAVWAKAKLMEGWHRAEIVRVTNVSEAKVLYRVRYDDGTVVKMPSVVAMSATVPGPGSKDNDDDRDRTRVLLRDIGADRERRRPDPVLSTLRPSRDLGCVSESFQSCLRTFLAEDPPALRTKSGGDAAPSSQAGGGNIVASPSTTNSSIKKKLKRRRSMEEERGEASMHDLKEAFELLMWVKYQRSLAAPGEAVGSIAAQSIGEPSTQMTLNTFHLAGHGGANVTLGIPRLREIIMMASRNLKTPSTLVPLRVGVARAAAESLARRLSRLPLSSLLYNVGGVTVRERIVKGDAGLWERHYAIVLKTFAPKLITKAFGIGFTKVCRTIYHVFIPHLYTAIRNDLKRTGERVTASGSSNVGRFRAKEAPNTAPADDGDVVEARDAENGEEFVIQRVKQEKAARKADAEYESEDEDEEGQGTLTFGKRKEQASYGGMDEDEKMIWKAMEGSKSDEDMDDEAVDDSRWEDSSKPGKGKDEAIGLPAHVTNSPLFKGVRKNKETGEVEVTIKLGSSVRRLLMVGLAEAAAAKTMVRSHKGVDRAFVMDTAGGGKSGVAIQLEGSCFETVWELTEAGPSGILDLRQLTSNDIWAVSQTYGVEAARASIVSEIKGVFGAYGIEVDSRHLGLVADHMTFDGGYRPLNRAGMMDFSSPCLQMSFETTTDFMMKAALGGTNDPLKSPSARIVMGRVGAFGTGMFDLRQPI